MKARHCPIPVKRHNRCASFRVSRVILDKEGKGGQCCVVDTVTQGRGEAWCFLEMPPFFLLHYEGSEAYSYQQEHHLSFECGSDIIQVYGASCRNKTHYMHIWKLKMKESLVNKDLMIIESKELFVGVMRKVMKVLLPAGGAGMCGEHKRHVKGVVGSLDDISRKLNFYCWCFQVRQHELSVLSIRKGKALLEVFSLFFSPRIANQFSRWGLLPFREKTVADLKFQYEWMVHMNTFVKYWKNCRKKQEQKQNKTKKPDVLLHTFNPSTLDAEAPGDHCELQDSLVLILHHM